MGQTIQTGWERPIGIQPRHSIIGMSASQENFSKNLPYASYDSIEYIICISCDAYSELDKS